MKRQAWIVVLFTMLSRVVDAQGGILVFTPLGDLPGGPFSSQANAISADGRWSSWDAGSTPIRNLKPFGGPQVALPLGDLPGGNFDSVSLGVSADGTTVVGIGNIIVRTLGVQVDAVWRNGFFGDPLGGSGRQPRQRESRRMAPSSLDMATNQVDIERSCGPLPRD
ncbi:MAG: hypothetical protein U1D30_21925 [Planctomycetota bacterium]